MSDDLKELGSASIAVREALFGRLSDAQVRAQLRYTEAGTDGAALLENELKRRRQERLAKEGWLGRTIRKFFG